MHTIHYQERVPVKTLALLIAFLVLQGCTTLVGTAVGTVTTVAVEVAKVPFKVAGAAVDVATDDEDEED
jgi:hypothetical protein